MLIRRALANRWLRRGAVAAAALVLAAVGIAIGMRLAGARDVDTDLGRVSFSIDPASTGRTDAYVPIADWGIRADTFDAPFALQVELRTLDRRGALALAGGGSDSLRATTDELEGEARTEVARAFAWGLGAVLLIAAGLGLARRWRFASLTVGCALLLTAAAVGAAALTADARAFASPSFYGRGQELAQLISFFERGPGTERYSSSFEAALRSMSAYLSEEEPVGSADEILLASDIHNNALVLPALSRFATGQPILLPGDFGHEGNESEARLIAPRIGALADEVVTVSGNHDSAGLMRALAREGATVLGRDGRLGADGEYRGSPIARVGSLRVAGFDDPLEWPGADPGSPRRVFSFGDLDDGEERLMVAERELVEWFGGLPVRPDIVLVHQNALAQHLAAELDAAGYDAPLIVATGHNHRQQIDRYGEVTVVNGGSLGAGGILGVGESAGLAELGLAGPDLRLTAVDFIRVEPLSGQAEADRVVLDAICPPDAVEANDGPCHFEPDRP